MLFIIFILIIAVALSALGVTIFYRKQFRYWSKLKVPHTRPKFPLGDIGSICFKKSPGECIGDLYAKSRGHRYLGVWFWFTPTLVVRDPELIKCILVRDFTHFHDRVPYVNVKRDPLSGHLFSLRGSRWRNLRPKLSPAFTTGRMKNNFHKFVECAENLITFLKNECAKGGIVEMREVAARFTTDVTCSYALGVRTDSLENRKAIFWRMGKKVFAPTIFNCFRSLVPLLVSRVGKTLALNPTPREVSEFFLDAVRKILELRENSQRSDDFLQCLIDLKKRGKVEIVDRDSSGEIKSVGNWNFSSNEAAAQAFIFFIAGLETSSLTIQYTLYELALNQEIQNKLRKEVTHVLSQYDGVISYDGLNEMSYLNKVLQETLRKYPVVPLVFRTCTKDYPVPDSDLIIPKGMQVQISVYGIHRDPDHYPEPEKFDPERFSEEEKAKRHNYAYIPFGDGPRNCLGMRFSLIQKKVGLIALLSNFHFDVCHNTPALQQFHPNSFFFAPKGGMPLKITKL